MAERSALEKAADEAADVRREARPLGSLGRLLRALLTGFESVLYGLVGLLLVAAAVFVIVATVEAIANAVSAGEDPIAVGVVVLDRILLTLIVAELAYTLRFVIPLEVIAARFHRAMAAVIVAGCERIRDRTGTTTVALSGGVFQNALLLDDAAAGLADRGFRVPPAPSRATQRRRCQPRPGRRGWRARRVPARRAPGKLTYSSRTRCREVRSVPPAEPAPIALIGR